MHTVRPVTRTYTIDTAWKLVAEFSEYRSLLVASVAGTDACYLWVGSEPATQPSLGPAGIRLNQYAPYIILQWEPAVPARGPVWARCHGGLLESTATLTITEWTHPPECVGHTH